MGLLFTQWFIKDTKNVYHYQYKKTNATEKGKA